MLVCPLSAFVPGAGMRGGDWLDQQKAQAEIPRVRVAFRSMLLDEG